MNTFEHLEGWGKILDEFRKTDIYKKSNGVNLFALFFEWISYNYEIPKTR